jgi:hypothetical protein
MKPVDTPAYESQADLISAWRALPLEHPPYALPEDLAVLSRSRTPLVTLKSYEAYLEKCLDAPNDSRFHLGLLPEPYFGDLTKATFFVLMLNPGLSPACYYGEYRAGGRLRDAIISNLRQDQGREFPFFYLDPEFAWHSGGRYFRARLHWLAEALVRQERRSYREALAQIAQRVAVLQLVPYHSPNFKSGVVLGKLESTALVKDFVRERVVPRTEIPIVVTRKASEWALPPDRPHTVTYEGSESRAAHLSPKSRGGQELARHFGISDAVLAAAGKRWDRSQEPLPEGA